jgi:hypothetical protein
VSAASVDILVSVGDSPPRIHALQLTRADQTTVTVVFDIDGSSISLSFGADRFVDFAERMRRFAATLPGRPS